MDRATGELVEVTLWNEVDAARAALPAPIVGVDPPIAVDFDVGDTWFRRSDAPPVALRTDIGRFSRRGSDVEMIDLVRERIPTIGDEMLEAAVGRRVVGGAVEVLFFSTWAREPADRPVEAPFWPDRSLRYDDFRIRVVTPLAPRPARPAERPARRACPGRTA
jgi:hypothetical protein